jgi:predicted RNase H-like HicB family nuclease
LVEVMAKRKYVARFERDENGYWSVTVDVGSKRTAVSDGQTLPKARRRIRQAVALLLEKGEDDFDLEEDVALPAKVRQALREYEAAKEAVIVKTEEAAEAGREAAAALEAHGLSRRDAGELLGLTGQRVQQLLAG